MTDEYLTIENNSIGEGFYSDKRSKFFAFARHVGSVDDVKRIVDGLRKEYHDARHVCWAYVLGADGSDVRANDDGEPSSTAGKPILSQLQKRGLTYAMVAVVRYYGGVNLGPRGLIDAYRESASDALDHCSTEQKQVEEAFTYCFIYDMMAEVMRVVNDHGLTIVAQDYTDECAITLSARKSIIPQAQARLLKLDEIYQRVGKNKYEE